MSKKIKAQINCPKCSQRFTVDLYRSIWVEIPENLKLVLNDEINRFICPSCAFTFNVDFPFLCTNVKKGFALWYEPRHDDEIDKDMEKYKELMGRESFYAQAQRIKDWGEFKNKIIELEKKNPGNYNNKNNRKSKASIFIRSLIISNFKNKISISAKSAAFIVMSLISLVLLSETNKWQSANEDYQRWNSGPKQRCENILEQAKKIAESNKRKICPEKTVNLKPTYGGIDYSQAPDQYCAETNPFPIMLEIGGEDCIDHEKSSPYAKEIKIIDYPEPTPVIKGILIKLKFKDVLEILIIFITLTGLILITLDALHRIIIENHVGWKRLWLVISSFVFITVFFIQIDETSDEIESLFLATLASIVSSLALIYGKLLFTWVAAGFQEDAKNLPLTSTMKINEPIITSEISATSQTETQSEDALQGNSETYPFSEMKSETIKEFADVNINYYESSLDNQHSIDTSSESVTGKTHSPENKMKKKELKGVGGWLLLFCVYIVILSPASFIGQTLLISLYADHSAVLPTALSYYPSIKLAYTLERYATALIVICGFFVGISIWAGSKIGKKTARDYLQIKVVTEIVTTCLMLWLTRDLPSEIYPSVIATCLGGAFAKITFFTIWWLYFKTSTRVKNTYGNAN